MRIKETKVYQYDELSEKAKEKARDWFRRDYPDFDWWAFLYEDFERRAKELGIELSKKAVPLMNGKTRYDPEIYFSGFYHQGSGSSFSGRWRAWDMNPDKLKSECPTDSELHRISNVLVDCANEDGEIWADIRAERDTWIRVDVNDGETIEEKLNELEYKSNEYNTLAAECERREEDITEAIRDFNRWIFRRLEEEYDYLTSDEQVEESIRANEYEFTEDGRIA